MYIKLIFVDTYIEQEQVLQLHFYVAAIVNHFVRGL